MKKGREKGKKGGGEEREEGGREGKKGERRKEAQKSIHIGDCLKRWQRMVIFFLFIFQDKSNLLRAQERTSASSSLSLNQSNRHIKE